MDAGIRIRHNYTIRHDSGCTLAVMAITGRNQNASGSDPACLLGLFRVVGSPCQVVEPNAVKQRRHRLKILANRVNIPLKS